MTKGKILQNMMECFFHLSILDLELMLIPDREPLRTTVELMSWQEWDFERRLLHDIEFLSFIVRLSLLQHTDIHDTSRDTSSCDDDFATIGRDTESLPSEDELVDGDVFEYLVFWHKIIRLRWADYRKKCRKGKYKISLIYKDLFTLECLSFLLPFG